MLSRDQILQAQDSKTAEVSVPEWGGTVLVRSMSGAERDAFERQQYELAKMGQLGDNMRARMVAFCVVDTQGNRLFSDDDIQALGQKSGIALERVVKAARTLNKLDDADIEATAKNSAPSPADSSI